jgi:cyclic pyranopterin phosphate synthase
VNSIPGPLTHLDETGAARMVDVSGKEPALRRAVASGVLRTTEEVVRLLRAEQLPKGDALATARVAGIMGAKRTPDLVPLCHPIALTGVTVNLEIARAEVRITATVRTTDRTGVEMEALVACSVGALTVYDMVKGLERGVAIEAVRLVEKTGGREPWREVDTGAPSG